jgi:hypothetical protein
VIAVAGNLRMMMTLGVVGDDGEADIDDETYKVKSEDDDDESIETKTLRILLLG